MELKLKTDRLRVRCATHSATLPSKCYYELDVLPTLPHCRLSAVEFRNRTLLHSPVSYRTICSAYITVYQATKQ